MELNYLNMLKEVIDFYYPKYLQHKDNEDSLIKICGQVIALLPGFFDLKLLFLKNRRAKDYGLTPETVEGMVSILIRDDDKEKFLIKCIDVFYELQDKNGKVYKMFFPNN